MMIRWVINVSLREQKTNEEVQQLAEVEGMADKPRDTWLLWYGYVQKREK